MATFKVFKLQAARELTKQGFQILEVMPNRDKPWLNVYGFENTSQLREAVRIITQN